MLIITHTDDIIRDSRLLPSIQVFCISRYIIAYGKDESGIPASYGHFSHKLEEIRCALFGYILVVYINAVRTGRERHGDRIGNELFSHCVRRKCRHGIRRRIDLSVEIVHHRPDLQPEAVSSLHVTRGGNGGLVSCCRVKEEPGRCYDVYTCHICKTLHKGII